MNEFFFNELKTVCRALDDLREEEIVRIVEMYDILPGLAHVSRTEGLPQLEDDVNALEGGEEIVFLQNILTKRALWGAESEVVEEYGYMSYCAKARGRLQEFLFLLIVRGVLMIQEGSSQTDVQQQLYAMLPKCVADRIDKRAENEPQVGLFFDIKGNLFFAGCSLAEAETYGDFLVFPKSHMEVWDTIGSMGTVDGRKVDFDYYPRGRIVYRKTDDVFILYYDACLENKLDGLIETYAGCNLRMELEEHYRCHNCNDFYVE